MKVGITQIGNKAWIGGNTYLKNLSGILKSQPNNKINLCLITNSLKIDKGIKNNFKSIIFFKNSIFKKLLNFLFSNEINNISLNHSIDVFFESTEYLGLFCKKNIITWLPDFQHKYYPEYFGLFSYWKRELSYWIRIKSRKRILVSSIDAKKDCIKFYKISPKKIFVAPFSIDLNPSNYFNKKSYLKKKYQIDKDYFYLPNQFWKHKNHQIIFKFLDKIYEKKRGFYKKLPKIILSGLSSDNRNTSYSNNLLKKIKSKKYRDKVKYLGLVPLNDVYTLNANSLALINPSLFEGWSTTVEEAKSLGTTMILSNIKIHREQSPKALFFNPKNVCEFENCIIKAMKIRKKKNYSKILKNLEMEKRKFAKNIFNALSF